MNKEQVYDTVINPLMSQIIEVCKANGIAMVASFDIPTEEQPDMRCTTMLPDESGKNPDHHKQIYRILRPASPSILHVRLTHEDGSQTLAAIVGD